MDVNHFYENESADGPGPHVGYRVPISRYEDQIWRGVNVFESNRFSINVH